ncbi:SRPBCC domain-containing protein [Micromonospora sp. DR5-3]|uniref:SRPBCC family protein n=1 Tax=unclassified Micromonospora TaxID=2617518 RepID=UPI0011DC3142|nr:MULTISPECIES: SRPBCC domain-containing protein [unclassified Micromonospora]MCW3819164.1 SRPBCC domain-containing protein [Micromonospora sp. DR5-3]TYC21090.1 SRPBCC domain-containing protein [Micromonospora sp. MP36]
MSESTAIALDQFLPHPPAKVWRALTDSDLLARWLMPNDFRPVPGHRFSFRTNPRPGQGFDGVIHCEVLELDEPRRLRWAWRGGRLDTVVSWTLVPEGRGTRLFLEHAGFDPDDPVQRRTFTLLDGGWRSHVWRRLEQTLTALP